MENNVVRLFGDAERATESSPDSKVSAVIHTVPKQSVGKAFYSSSFQSEVENAVKKSLSEPHVSTDVPNKAIVSPKTKEKTN